MCAHHRHWIGLLVHYVILKEPLPTLVLSGNTLNMNYITNVSPFYVSKEERDRFTIKSHTERSWFNLEAQMFQYLSCKEFRPEGELDTEKWFAWNTNIQQTCRVQLSSMEMCICAFSHHLFNRKRARSDLDSRWLSALTSCYSVKMWICCRGMFCSRDTFEVSTTVR